MNTIEYKGLTSSPVADKIMETLFYEEDTDYLSPVMTPKTECKLSTLLKNVAITSESVGLKKVKSAKKQLFGLKRQHNELEESRSVKRRCSGDLYDRKLQTDVGCAENKQSSVLKPAINEHSFNEDMIGDRSRPYRLPTVTGKHKDLKSITPKTLVDVMSGRYAHVISSYRIIDCRYPYEFKGGHIKGAENIFTEEGIMALLNEHSEDSSSSRDKSDIIIFHCEFSSERGPKKCRFLRNKDRQLNQENYPRLNFPELYILDQGYKQFYAEFKEECSPMSYKPMLHADHNDDLRYFRQKSKTWSGREKRTFSRHSIRF
ncbi:hypothetical protein FSP39_003537 [Pinctada imbricata]|uniref:M-phase inducer phosphatase n=1 Tax=Pinctada imbricata TaxID=66713 RepID=A0AA88Y274_PINIB|nr:hypothetical protein FSP39_003537 [Pinctada imbricata]